MSKINGIETEWSRLQRKFGNLPEPEEEEKDEPIPEALSKKEVAEGLSYNQLQKELEKAAIQDDDEQMLMEIKKRRMQELKQQAAKNKFGSLINIAPHEYIEEVSKASNECTVVCHLYSDKEECKVLDSMLNQVAAKHAYVKFCRVKASLAIPNFPEKNTPTLLIYKGGEMKTQIIGLAQFGGVNKISKLSVELILAQYKIVQSLDMEELIAKVEKDSTASKVNFVGKKSRRKYDSDESESDDD